MKNKRKKLKKNQKILYSDGDLRLFINTTRVEEIIQKLKYVKIGKHLFIRVPQKCVYYE